MLQGESQSGKRNTKPQTATETRPYHGFFKLIKKLANNHRHCEKKHLKIRKLVLLHKVTQILLTFVWWGPELPQPFPPHLPPPRPPNHHHTNVCKNSRFWRAMSSLIFLTNHSKVFFPANLSLPNRSWFLTLFSSGLLFVAHCCVIKAISSCKKWFRCVYLYCIRWYPRFSQHQLTRTEEVPPPC